jgi:hypothetical protein
VGEIGMPRREFLYEIRGWEARRIMKGYQRRNVLMYQLQRMQVWASLFCMGNPEKKSPIDIFHLYFDDWDKETVPVDEETVKDLLADIAAENRRIARQQRKSKKKK